MYARVTAFVLLLVVATSSAQPKRFDGDKVFRIIPNNAHQLNFVRQFLDAPSDHFDFWVEPTVIGQPVDLHVAAKTVDIFSALLNASNIPNWVTISDVQKMIDDVTAENAHYRETRTSIVGTFPTHAALNAWLLQLCAENPATATCGDIGHSYENRTIKYIKLAKPSETGAVKQKIFLECGMHAREWISPATSVYFIDRLLNSYNSDPTSKRMLDTYDWIIIPSSNPDGYEYTRSKDRMWRKTRSKVTSYCYGVDPNRNWGYKFGEGGASTQPCSDTYQGPKAFSEPETTAISNFIFANKANTRAYFSFHSFAQMWLIPYGIAPKPDDFDELLRVAKIGVTALQGINKTTWKVGNIIDLLYPASGGSIDWAKGIAGIPYSYCLELRPAMGTLNGFIVGEKEIDPSGREAWAGLIAAIDAIPNK